MSDAANPDVPTETQDAPGSDVYSSPPPPYPDLGLEPPPYSAAPEMYPPPKAEVTCVSEPGIGCESLGNVEVLRAEATTESNPFDDKTVRRAFVRKVCVLRTSELIQRVFCVRLETVFVNL